MHVVPILQSLMINSSLDTVDKLQNALIAAEVNIAVLPKDTPYQNFEQRSLLFLFFCFCFPFINSMDRLRWNSKLFKQV